MNGSLVQLAEGGIRGKRLSLKNRQSVTFGSDFSCTVILRTEGFKPKQAVMSVGEGNQIWFKNLDTTSDMVKVNGVPVVQPVAIKNADEISFESCVCFVYEADVQAPPAPSLTPLPEMLPSDLNVIEPTKLQELLQPKQDDSYQYINEQIKQRKLSNSSSTVPTSATSKESTNEDGAETDDEEKRDSDAHKEKVARESMQVDDKSSKEGGEEEEEGDEEEYEDLHKPEKAEGKKDDMDVGKDHKEEGAEEEEEKKADQSEEKPKPVVERKPAPSVEGSGEAKVARTTEQGKQSSEVRIKFAASEHANLLQNLLNDGMTGQVNVSKDSVGGLTLTIHFPNVLRGGRRGPPPKQTLKRPTQQQPGRPANPSRGPARTTATGGRPGGPTAVGSKRKRSPPPPPSIGARGQGGARGPLPRKPPIPTMPGRKVPLRTGGPLTKPGPRPGPGRPPLRAKDVGEEEEDDDDASGMFLLPNGHGGLSRRSHRLAQQGPVKKQKTDSEEGGEEDATAEGDEKDGEKAEDEGISKAKRALAKLSRSKHAPHDSEGGGVGMTLLWAAEKVLREERKPMKSPEIIKKGREKGYIATDSKRADNSLVGRFSTSITKDPDTPFVRVSPATYGLKELVSHYRDMGYMDGTSDSKE